MYAVCDDLSVSHGFLLLVPDSNLRIRLRIRRYRTLSCYIDESTHDVVDDSAPGTVD